MNESCYRPLSAAMRLAGALAALVCSVCCLGAVIAVLASASGELTPVLAKAGIASPPASTVASKGSPVSGKGHRG